MDLPVFSRLFMWLQQPEVGTGTKPLKVMSSGPSKLGWTRPGKQKNEILTSLVTSKFEHRVNSVSIIISDL